MYKIAKELVDSELTDTELGYERFVAIWAFAVFRGMCWASGHYMVEGTKVGGEHLGSRMPIYIG